VVDSYNDFLFLVFFFGRKTHDSSFDMTPSPKFLTKGSYDKEVSVINEVFSLADFLLALEAVIRKGFCQKRFAFFRRQDTSFLFLKHWSIRSDYQGIMPLLLWIFIPRHGTLSPLY